MNYKFSIFSVELSFLVAVAAFAQEVPSDHATRMAAGRELFKKEVRKVLVTQCLRCHGGEELEGEFNIATREGLLKGGSSGKPAVVPGKSSESLFMELIKHQKEPEMPMDSPKLPTESVAMIAKWIDLGAPYDQPLLDQTSQGDWTKRKVEQSAREYWAFKPLERYLPEKFKTTAPQSNEIDGFIFANHLKTGTQSLEAADDRTHVRRLYLDLLGVPPTPEEVEAYLSGNDPQKYNKLVERLLDDERFGERWARHWLDVARFAESHGFEHDYDRPYAYHYRDFVIKAFNQDLPYDEFVRWQIAGDEFEPDNPLAMMATGFLGAGVYPTQITAKEVERVRYDALDDMVATIGTGMLGLTIGCARCHDHKFDPIPQADYYRLVSTFTKTVRSNISLPIKPANKEELAKYVKAHESLATELAIYDKEKLPKAFGKWESERGKESLSSGWSDIELIEFKSAGGATMKQLPDGSILVSGSNVPFDTYTIVLKTSVHSISALMLETLADKSLPRGGPGRAPNGNFALSNLKVTAQPLEGDAQPIEIKFIRAKATFDRNSLESWKAIDDDAKSAYALDPHIGQNHQAFFETTEDVGFDGGTKLVIEMRFNNNTQHNIGRFRLKVTDAIRPVKLELKGPPGEIVQLLSADSSRRSKEQTQKLLQWYANLDPERRALQQKLVDLESNKPKPETATVMVTSEGYKAIRHHTQGGDFLNETHYLKRGDADQKVRVANSGFLQVLMRHPDGVTHWTEEKPENSRTSYQRRALANWVTDVEHGAGHLMARVIVNRLWHHHFGRGLVATPNDFGRQSQPPTHPELLDYLALKLIENDWSLKSIHRLILQCATYRQSSSFSEANYKADPENVTLWRFQPRRLEAEAIRDSYLSISGMLDSKMYGPGTLDPNMTRRSIYFTVKRSRLIPMMTLFDVPEPLGSIGRRDATTIAPQALLFINSPQVRKAAEMLAARIDDGKLMEVVRKGYLHAVNREPTEQELTRTIKFLEKQQASYARDKKENARRLAVGDFCQTLFALNEFSYMLR